MLVFAPTVALPGGLPLVGGRGFPAAGGVLLGAVLLLLLFLLQLLVLLPRELNLDITTWAGDTEPWQPYSVGGDGNPGFFNVGNASARTNNSDDRWSALITTAQVQNCAPRIYNSGRNKADREVFFEPYLTLAKYLCTVWDRYENVIALELMNEPLLGGLPNLCTCLSTWRQILTFQGDVLEALDEDPSIKCPIVIDNWSSTVEGESCAVKLLSCIGASSSTMKRFQSYAERNRLILSFHYYSPPANVSFEELIALAKKNDTAQKMADRLAMACDLGVNATTYWQYADTAWTEQPGWYKYPPSVTNAGTGVPVNVKGVIDDQAWAAFSKTVADGTFFSASITGASGAQMEVLQLVPASETASASASASAAAAPAPAAGALGASGPGRGWRRGAEKELLPWPKDRPTCLHKPKRCLLPGESPAA
ncbi:unnamed protein product [Effrenium voratum]|nr:unnamed protein product [Effrenium voratum]